MFATGVGSLPGTDMPGALGFVLGAFDHAWLPELPARGVGADMVGRATALLDGLDVDLQPQGWRLGSAGVDHGRAKGWLRRDLDELEEAAQHFTDSVTLTCTGPWTLVSCLELPRGDKVLRDRGARRDVAESLGLGLSRLLAEMRRRLPDITWRLQLDEPLLPPVLTGAVPTASGFARHRPVDRPEVSELLARTVDQLRSEADVVLHSCASWAGVGGVDTDLLQRAGVDWLALDLDQLRPADWDRLGPWIESGRGLQLGVVPTTSADTITSVDRIVSRSLSRLRPLGLDPELLEGRLALSPACGMTSWSTGPAARQLEALLTSVDLLTEQLHR
ncbi:hypothetical protein ACTQ49_01025 [Luteococcus sp. Sow4_B9]|uniref:hypothetical protein n=1 Tax=Luteococcus sp. Sow4_B9 TaxID=3438792 RepID=UPI003F9A4D31